MLLQAIKEREKGQIEISAPTPAVVVTRWRRDKFSTPPSETPCKKFGIRERNTNRHFQNVMWLKAPWVKRQISCAKALWNGLWQGGRRKCQR